MGMFAHIAEAQTQTIASILGIGYVLIAGNIFNSIQRYMDELTFFEEEIDKEVKK